MKRIFIVSIMVLAFVATNAQDAKNTLKWNAFGLVARTISLQYERVLTDHISLGSQVGYMLPRNLPGSLFPDTVNDQVGSNGQVTHFTGGKFKGGFQVTPEFRYYFKGEGNRGFYLGAYVRYANYSMSIDAIHREDWGSEFKPYEFTGKYSMLHVGGIMGTQFFIGDKITIDWWILGLSFGKSTIDMKATGDFSNLNQEEFINDIRINLDDNPFVKQSSIETSISNTEASLKFGIPLPSLRTGLCLGFRF